MADQSPDPGSRGATGDGSDTDSHLEPTTGAPRWVKVFGIIAIVLVVAFVVLHLTGLAPEGH
jgi:hypothetical protein